MGNIFLVAAAVLPAAVLCVYIYKKDRVEKEPPGLLARLFFFGVLICFPAGWIESLLISLNTGFFQAVGVVGENGAQTGSLAYIACLLTENVVCVALVEESLKWLALFFTTRRNPNFNSFFDGVVYAVFVSLGFAAYENIIYVYAFGFEAALLRAWTAVPGHMFFAVIMGLQYSRWHALTNARRLETQLYEERAIADPPRLEPGKSLAMSLILPTVFHGAYDFCCSSDHSPLLNLAFYALLLGLYFFSFRTVKNLSRNDSDVGTVAVQLVASVHADFKAALQQAQAQEQERTAALARSAAGARAGTGAAPYTVPSSAPMGQNTAPYAVPSTAPMGQNAAQPYTAPYTVPSSAPMGQNAAQPYAAQPYAAQPRFPAVVTSAAAARLFVRCGDPSVEGVRVFRMPNGDRYSGYFKNGAAEGFGTYYFSDGRQVTGYWSGGRLC